MSSSALSWQGLPLTRDEPAKYGGFGFATATNGEVVAVGAYLEAPTGAVYLFEKVAQRGVSDANRPGAGEPAGTERSSLASHHHAAHVSLART